jgi:actin-related protein
MPFYEGIGLIAEKNAVVIDIGSAYTKVGYAGEATPRAIVNTPKELKLWERPNDEQLYDVLGKKSFEAEKRKF